MSDLYEAVQAARGSCEDLIVKASVALVAAKMAGDTKVYRSIQKALMPLGELGTELDKHELRLRQR